MSRKPALSTEQLAFTFEAPPLPRGGELAGIDRMVAAAVGRILKDDERSREEIAAAMSVLLGETVSKEMLDAYASEARERHNISHGRFLALVAATQRHDVADTLMSRAGGRVIFGEEVHAAHLGHLRSRIRQLQAEERRIASKAQPFARELGRR